MISTITPAAAEPSLNFLAEQINVEHRAVEQAVQSGLAHAVRAGELLTEAKAQCPHGQWLPWLENNFDGSTRTAQAYMRVFTHRDEIEANAQGLAHLGFEAALKLLAEPRPEPPTPTAHCDELVVESADGDEIILPADEDFLESVRRARRPENRILGIDDDAPDDDEEKEESDDDSPPKKKFDVDAATGKLLEWLRAELNRWPSEYRDEAAHWIRQILETEHSLLPVNGESALIRHYESIKDHEKYLEAIFVMRGLLAESIQRRKSNLSGEELIDFEEMEADYPESGDEE